MRYITEQIVKSLREARLRKGLSQRDLSVRTGIPQSHISKIESGGVDLRISSLIALARVLDLELIAAPKKTVTAIQSIIKNSQGICNEEEPIAPAYQLEFEEDDYG